MCLDALLIRSQYIGGPSPRTGVPIFLQRLVPDARIVSLVGEDSAASIPLVATTGAPMFLNGYAALPLVAGTARSRACRTEHRFRPGSGAAVDDAERLVIILKGSRSVELSTVTRCAPNFADP